MRIHSNSSWLPELGAARAQATGRAWYLMADTLSGREHLSDDPSPNQHRVIAGVFLPEPPA